MDETVEYPDADLARSPTHGEVFQVPILQIENDESEGSYNDKGRRTFVRPQSAKGPSLEVPSRVLPSKPRGIRPWSAQPKTRKTDSQRKLSRQPLRKPHFRPPVRSPTASISSDTSSLITAVGLANNATKPLDTSENAQPTEKHQELPHVSQAKWAVTIAEAAREVEEQEEPIEKRDPINSFPNNTILRRSTSKTATKDKMDVINDRICVKYGAENIETKGETADVSQAKWAVTIAEAVKEVEEQDEPIEKPDPVKRSLKKHPSFETWLQGSPHDSDEYDTDLDIDDYVKTITEDKPVDPTGRAIYMDQCQTQGQIPVSYIQRHLGDKNLRMRHHYLGGEGTKPIAVALLKNTITEIVDISDNYVESEGCRYIAGMMKNNTFITNLNISSNFIGQDGFRHICTMLETNTTLKTLTASGNQLRDPCAKYLIEGLKNNSSLTSLDLSGNDFGEIGGIYIGGALSVNEGLMDADLSWNSIRGKGAAAIISSLTKNKSLEVLDLSWNGIGFAGADAFRVGLKFNNSLKVLDLTNNRLNTKAVESLALGLSRNTGLETLILNMNPMKDAGVEVILKAVEKHTKLSLLSLEEIAISLSNYHKIKELESQKDITILHGGVGGYHRPSATTSMMKLFSKFVQTHQKELDAACQPYDSDRNGLLGVDELKMALKEGGLRLTNRHMNLVVEELNLYNRSTLNYRDILSGRTLQEYFRQRPSRAVAITTSQKAINSLPDTLHRQLTVM